VSQIGPAAAEHFADIDDITAERATHSLPQFGGIRACHDDHQEAMVQHRFQLHQQWQKVHAITLDAPAGPGLFLYHHARSTAAVQGSCSISCISSITEAIVDVDQHMVFAQKNSQTTGGGEITPADEAGIRPKALAAGPKPLINKAPKRSAAMDALNRS